MPSIAAQCQSQLPPNASRRRSQTAPPYTGNLRLNSAVLQALSLSQLREICQSNGLPVTGNRATLHRRLKDAGITSEGPEERRNASVSPQQTNDTPARPQRHETPSFSEEQMAHIKRLVQETVSSEAARAAMHAMQAQQSPPFTASDGILPSSSPRQTHVQQTEHPSKTFLPLTSRISRLVSFFTFPNYCQKTYLCTTKGIT